MKIKRITGYQDIDKVLTEFIAKGFGLSRGKTHYKMTSPDGKQSVGVASSPSDHRAALNLRSQLRRMERGVTLQ